MLETDVRYSGYTAARAAATYDELRRRVAALPGVEGAMLTHGQPMEVAGLPLVIEDSDAGDRIVGAGRIRAGPGFFDVMQISCSAASSMRGTAPAAARRGDHRVDGTAVLWRRQRRRSPLPPRSAAGLNRGRRRRPRYRNRRPLGLVIAFMVILAMRAFANPAPGIAIYRPSVGPLQLLAIVAILLAVGVAAAFVPARRAAGMSPVFALRQE